jgi:hypothetical protein
MESKEKNVRLVIYGNRYQNFQLILPTVLRKEEDIVDVERATGGKGDLDD